MENLERFARYDGGVNPQILQTISTADKRYDALEVRSRIAVEANFLRLPLFALHTKGLRNLDGFECRGKTTRGDNTWEFVFRTARSTATLYPGPLSRSIHLAFLSLITEQGRPLTNPISWSWWNLCQRLDVTHSGQMLQRLKKAIEATAGLTIYSRDALYLKPTGKHLSSRKAMHLYDMVVFANETMPNGTTANTNYLWLSQWYLENLNSLFTAPLDHELWRFLDKRSQIASRLYEFLLINFYSGTPQLRINYPRLAQFLPVRSERYLSDARKQLEPAFELLKQVHITESVTWQKSKQDVAQLHFDRGSRLLRTPKNQLTPLVQENGAPTISVREIRRTPEQELVSEFYRLWTDRPTQRPTSADLGLARRLIAEHGLAKAKAFLPLAIQELKQHWPKANTFVAIEHYIGAASELHQRQLSHKIQKRRHDEQEQIQYQELERQRIELQQFEALWQPRWEQLSEAEHETIREELLSMHPFLRHTPFQWHSRCLQELARRAAVADETPEIGDRP